MEYFTVFILSLFLTIALVPVFKRLAFRMNIVDVPDARKVHVMPMPKTGGISMAIGAFVPMLIWLTNDHFVSSVFIGAFIIVAFGLVDDIKVLSAKQKVLPQIAAALVVIFLGGVRINCFGDLAPPGCLLPDYIAIPFTLFVILGVTNAINLSDGLDGLAGGISMLSFLLIALLAYQSGNHQIAIIAIAMVGGIAGFLRYNTHPAILFMGDAGSQLLGFLSVVLAIVLTQSNTPYSKVLALPIIGFSILDTLAVMIERMIKKRSPFKPDKNHFHHRLLAFGFYHTEAVFIIYIIQACFISQALVFRYYSDWLHLSGVFILSALILGTFLVGRTRNWEFRREGSFDTKIKKRLKLLKERKLFIRIAFSSVRYGFPMLLACQVAIAGSVPKYLSVLAVALVILVGVSFFFNLKLKEKVLRFAVYTTTPLLIYLTESRPAGWMTTALLELNTLGFVCLVGMVILTLNLTKRRKGFKISPLDILVLIVILVFPNLPSLHLVEFNVGITLAKALVLFFSYDVLIGELRGETGLLAKPVIGVLVLLVIRGIIG